MAERKTERRLGAKYPKTCVICGIDFMAKYSHSKACSAECSNALHYRQKEILNRANYGVYIKPGPVQKKQSYTSPISDAEQLALNRLIDSMNTYRPDQGRTISRGTRTLIGWSRRSPLSTGSETWPELAPLPSGHCMKFASVDNQVGWW